MADETGITKQDLLDLEERTIARTERSEERFEQKLLDLEERLSSRFEQKLLDVEERLSARIEKSETNLLTAFHGWARAMEVKVRGVTTVTFGFEERLTYMEERVSHLERRKQ